MFVTDTPWGPAEDLRKRMLRPGRTQTADANARSQRERLFGAMVATVYEKGYEQTTVADLLELAGVSRAAFYQHFSDKQDCFMATYRTIVEGALTMTLDEYETDRPWGERLGAGFARLLELIAAEPAAAHFCLVDLYAAGPVAIEQSVDTRVRYEQLLRRALADSPPRADLPPAVTRAIVGGAHKVLTSRVRRNLAEELPALAPAIASWALSYHSPPGTIRKPRARKPPPGGPQFGPYGDAGRILEAIGLEVSERGYQAATIEGIAARASASTHTFYKHFTSKADALEAGYDAAVAQALAITQPAFARAPDWPHAVRAALQALLTFLAGNPAWARTAIVESLAAGATLMERSDRTVDAFAALLEPGLERAPDIGQVATEATAGAIHVLVYDQVVKVGPARLLEILPACVFVGLAPFVGTEHALAIANDGARTGQLSRGR